MCISQALGRNWTAPRNGTSMYLHPDFPLWNVQLTCSPHAGAACRVLAKRLVLPDGMSALLG